MLHLKNKVKIMNRLLSLTLIFLFASNAESSFCPSSSNDRELKVFLCHAGRWVLGKYVPYGKEAVRLLDQYFGKKITLWDTIKGNVESYVREKIDVVKMSNINVWHSSMTARIATCQAKVDLNIKKSCYRNLQEDLSGYEPRFRGTTMKEIAQYLKYYDVYVITFLSVSDILRNLSDSNLKASIDRDVSLKGKIFADYLKDAIPKTEAYVCRHIRIDLKEDYIFWKEHRLTWPKITNVIPALLHKNTSKYDVWFSLFDPTVFCDMFQMTNWYEANIVDTTDNTLYPGGPWRDRYCNTHIAIANIIPKIYDTWKTFMRICVESAENVWLNEIRDRLDRLKALI